MDLYRQAIEQPVNGFTSDGEHAAQKGFASFNSLGKNGYQHICLNLPDGGVTITCRNSEGKQVTFAFCPNAGPRTVLPGHQCVDIVRHDTPRTEKGSPIQQAAFYGEGPTNAVCKFTDSVPTTIVSLSLSDIPE